MKGEERKARLVVEESVRDGKKGVKVRFEGTIERYSAFVASVITSYRNAIMQNYGPDAKKAVNESLKDFIDLEGTDNEVMEFPAKVYSRLKDADLDIGAMMRRLLLSLLEDLKSEAEDDVEND